MILFTKEIERKLEKAGDGMHANKAVCKIFNPFGAGTWVVFGKDLRDPDILYAACDLGFGCVEFGGVRRSDLEGFVNDFGCGLERDRHFTNAGKPLSFFLEQDTLVGI